MIPVEDFDNTGLADTESGKSHFHLRAWIFFAMLVFALVGMGLTMSREDGGWEFWIFLLTFYSGVSVFWAWQRARRNSKPVWRMVRTQVFHWGCVLLTFGVLVLLERTDIISREATADVALLILALGCVLAGVHFEWMFLLVGFLLVVMAIALSFLEQSFVWIIMIVVMAVVGWGYFQIRKRRVSIGDGAA